MVSASAEGHADAASELGDCRRRLWHPLARPGRGPEHGRTAAWRARPESIRPCEVDPRNLFSSFRWLPQVTFFPAVLASDASSPLIPVLSKDAAIRVSTTEQRRLPPAIATTTTGKGDMHKLLATLLSLSLTLSAAAQDNASLAPSLTIYNHNFFVAPDHLTLTLHPA